MFPAVMSNSASVSHEARICSGPIKVQEFGSLINPMTQQSSVSTDQPLKKTKKKRNLPGNPDPDAEVIALSPKTIMATNRFVCEICNKGFQREQNLQLHRRGHNLPWKLKQRINGKEMKKKRVYVCPELTCVHHHPSRALGDLTGIKKHFCRKHYNGEKKWKCEKCSKIYAVQSDWKAHTKTCGTKEYPCDCGTIFSRKDSFVTHRILCDALAESAKLSAPKNPNTNTTQPNLHFNPPPPPPSLFPFSSHHCHFPDTWDPLPQNLNPQIRMTKYDEPHINTFMMTSPFRNSQSAPTTTLPSLSATALLQKAATVGAVGQVSSTMSHLDMHATATWQKSTGLTRDFLGLTDQCSGGNVDHGEGSASVEVLSYVREVDYQPCDRGHSGFNDQSSSETWGNY